MTVYSAEPEVGCQQYLNGVTCMDLQLQRRAMY